MARNSLLKAVIASNSPRPPVHRDLFWLCRAHLRKLDVVGDAARRLMTDTTPQPGQWMFDLQLIIDETWAVNPHTGLYRYSLRAQGAAMRLAERMKQKDWGQR